MAAARISPYMRNALAPPPLITTLCTGDWSTVFMGAGAGAGASGATTFSLLSHDIVEERSTSL